MQQDIPRSSNEEKTLIQSLQLICHEETKMSVNENVENGFKLP